MTCRLIGKPIETAEMSDTPPAVTQKFTLSSTEPNKVLRAVVLALAVENPSMTALTLSLWSDKAGSPSKLIATSSNSKSRSDLLGGSTDNYGFGWFGFIFNKVPLRAGSTYHLALRCTGYTYSANQHLAWLFAYPDPPYRTGITLTAAKGANHPLFASIITAEL